MTKSGRGRGGICTQGLGLGLGFWLVLGSGLEVSIIMYNVVTSAQNTILNAANIGGHSFSLKTRSLYVIRDRDLKICMGM